MANVNSDKNVPKRKLVCEQNKSFFFSIIRSNQYFRPSYNQQLK